MKDIHSKTLHLTQARKNAFKRLIKYQMYGYTPDQETLDYFENNKELLTWDFSMVDEYD